MGQSLYDGLMLMAALANRAGSMEVETMAEVADGTSFESARGQTVLDGNHVAQTIYLADGTGGSFGVVVRFDEVGHGVTCE
jgi:urea transport system substrate-binding protein